MLDGADLVRRAWELFEAREWDAARDLFSVMGANAFAARAERELAATGEHARRRGYTTFAVLTPQESQIGQLAAAGATNQEIAGKLFLSASTVDYHLRKAFRKLGVKSRHQLEQHLLLPGAHAETAARGNRPSTRRPGRHGHLGRVS